MVDALENLQREKREYQDQIDVLTTRIAELEKQNIDLGEQGAREILQLTQDKQGMVDALVNLQKEHQELRDSIIDLTRENQSLVDALKLSQSEKQEDQNAIDALTQEKQWFVDTLVQLRKENQNYKKLNQQLDLQKSVAQEDVSRLENELSELHNNLEAKSLENKSIQAEFDKLSQSTMAIHVQNDGKSNRILELEEQNQRLLIDLENTKREVVDYVMSDSWKITKPLRRISKFLKRGEQD